MPQRGSGTPVTGRMVVGYDATTPSYRALLWAAKEAERRGARLTVAAVVASTPPVLSRPSEMVRSWRAAQDRARRQASAGAAQAVAAAAGLEVEAVGHVGSPGAFLVSLSRRADAVVLGLGDRRPADPYPSAVVEAVVRRAYPPVILVGRQTSAPREAPGSIVVGVDGSPEAMRAVEAGAALAAAADAPLRLVCVLDVGTTRGRREIGAYGRRDPATLTEAAQIAHAAEERARAAAGDVRVSAAVVPGRAPAVLAQEAAGSALLVVGRRGHGAERTLMLGSVTSALLGTVPAPVAVVGLRARTRADVEPLRLVRHHGSVGGLPAAVIPAGRQKNRPPSQLGGPASAPLSSP
jgi:nucleotide-binding universal stress UspA family protein